MYVPDLRATIGRSGLVPDTSKSVGPLHNNHAGASDMHCSHSMATTATNVGIQVSDPRHTLVSIHGLKDLLVQILNMQGNTWGMFY